MRRVLVVGATSAMAQETAKILAGEGSRFFLVGRDKTKLTDIAADLVLRGGKVDEPYAINIANLNGHLDMVERAFEAMGGVDVLIVAHGTNPDLGWQSWEVATETIMVNGVSAVSVAAAVADRFVKQGHGLILLISSVAGDRGKQSNYTYCAAKALVSRYAEGLRHRLIKMKSGVRVVDIKPGLTDTPLTAGLKKGLLWVGPATIATGIVGIIHRYENLKVGQYLPGTVYLPSFWRFVMLVIRHIPDKLFIKTNL